MIFGQLASVAKLFAQSFAGTILEVGSRHQNEACGNR